MSFPGCVRTYSGRHLQVLCPSPADILIDDIAHALSHLCRFTGHTREFYSVAQHSVLVSQFCDPQDALWGLLHDAAEAYLSDVSEPVKLCKALAEYGAVEEALLKSIVRRFGLVPVTPDSVRRADKLVLATEFRDLTTANDIDWITRECGASPLHAIRIKPWSPERARDTFLHRFKELTRDAR